MRNGSKIKEIMSLAEKLPYFSLDDLTTIEKDKNYLKILFSRHQAAGRLIRLKKGLYTTKEYLDRLQKQSNFSAFMEFLASLLYQPSYLSLDYVLYQYNLLTEMPVNFTSVTKNKTAHFTNSLGNFFYHTVSARLFCGFETNKEADFIIFKATKAKALFDFLYLRKNFLNNKKSVDELRLNLANLSRNDFKELKKYIFLEKSQKMKKLYEYLIV